MVAVAFKIVEVVEYVIFLLVNVHFYRILDGIEQPFDSVAFALVVVLVANTVGRHIKTVADVEVDGFVGESYSRFSIAEFATDALARCFVGFYFARLRVVAVNREFSSLVSKAATSVRPFFYFAEYCFHTVVVVGFFLPEHLAHIAVELVENFGRRVDKLLFDNLV